MPEKILIGHSRTRTPYDSRLSKEININNQFLQTIT